MAALTRSAQDPVPILLGAWAAGIALAPAVQWKLALILAGIVIVLLAWIARNPYAWTYVFFFSLFALPPLPIADGDSGLHIGPLVTGIGVIVGLVRLRNWHRFRGTLPRAFIFFVSMLLLSVGLAAFYSGMEIALGSLVRVLLFSLGVYVFAFALVAESGEAAPPFRFVKFLFYTATTAAAFACVDFYFQLPAPAEFGPQFVWLPEGVFRRAQGLFYEASTLGNFCAFFLVMILVSLFRPKVESPISRSMLLIAGSIFGAAMIFSYSRGSIINLFAALLAFFWIRHRSDAGRIIRGYRKKGFMAVAVATVVAVIAVNTLFPSFATSYWTRITTSFQYAAAAPDWILSGRLKSWGFLLDAIAQQPVIAVFGIGYKTLPYSTYLGSTVIADNTYLQLLVETGIIGLGAFLFLNAAIVRTGFLAAQSPKTNGRFFGEWIFCFWIGQMVQMLSGDLITYWRVLPAYFWVLAMAAREVSLDENPDR